MRRSSTPAYFYLIYVGIALVFGCLGYIAFYDLEVSIDEVSVKIPFDKIQK